MLLYKQDRYVEALTEFHDAKRRWLNGDSIEGAILAMQMIARCYGLLGLHLAAKQYWMAAASLSDMDGAQARYVARAFEQVAIGAYQMGMWLDSAAFTHAALLANRALVANANGGGPEALPSLDAHAIYTTLAANRYWPQVTDTLKAAFGGTAWATDLPEVAQSAGEEVDWSEAEFSQLVADQLHAQPFADVGPIRTYQFGILGGTWRIKCSNAKADVLAAERLGAALQVVLCDLAGTLPYVLCGDTTVTVSTEPPDDPYRPIIQDVGGRSLEVTAHVDAFQGRDSYDETMLLTMVTELVFLISAEDQRTTLAHITGRGDALLRKVFVAGPYDEIVSLLRDQHYEACAALESVCPSATAMPESHPQLGPLSSPAPDYNPDEAIERITNSYKNLTDHLQATLPVLKEDPAYQDLVRRLHEEGWLDWQILQGTANAAFTHRATLTTGMGQMTANARERAALRAEKEGAPALPAAVFTEGAVRSGLDTAVLIVAIKSVALHVDQLVQRVADLHEIGRVLHHLVDRLVGRGNLVDERVGVAVLDPDHRLAQLLPRERLPRLGARERASSAVRGGVQRHRLPLPLDDVAGGAHRSGDQAGQPLVGLDGSLAGHPDILAEVGLAFGEVVVAVDALEFEHVLTHRLREFGDGALHHLLTVQQGEVLSPLQFRDVVAELARALDEVGEVGVGQVDPPLLRQPLRDLDVVPGDPVADATRTRVEEEPD